MTIIYFYFKKERVSLNLYIFIKNIILV